jgi:hypothetical protein
LDTLQLWRKLAKGIQEFRKTSEENLFPAHDLIPYVVSYWNHTKGGQDTASRILKNIKVDFRVLSPRGFIYIRFIMTMLMNAYQATKVMQIEGKLNIFDSYKAMKREMNKDYSFWDFLFQFTSEWEPSTRLSLLLSTTDEIPQDTNAENEIELSPNERQLQLSQNIHIEQQHGRETVVFPDGQRLKVPIRDRLKHYNSNLGRKLRKSLPEHYVKSGGKSRRCVVCENRTTAFCTICRMPICTQVPPSGNLTCLHRFHNNKVVRKISREVKAGHKGRRGRDKRSIAGGDSVEEHTDEAV